MANESISDRVERLELAVSGLATIPSEVSDLAARTATVESQVLQLRSEMRVEFSALRGWTGEEFAAVREELAATQRETREEFAAIRGEFAAIRGEFAAVSGEFAVVRGEFAVVRGEFAVVRREFAAVREDLAAARRETREEFATVRSEMQEGFVAVTTELGRQILESESRSRAMFEEALSRIATISERRKPRR